MKTIKVSDTTTIVRGTPKIKKVADGFQENVFEITQTITLSCRVPTTHLGHQSECCRCGASMSTRPDSDAGEYILANHDGFRLLFPITEREAKERPERDSFPVAGWERVGDDLLCPSCHSAYKKLVGEFMEASK